MPRPPRDEEFPACVAGRRIGWFAAGVQVLHNARPGR
jgi:hypothetical protein